MGNIQHLTIMQHRCGGNLCCVYQGPVSSVKESKQGRLKGCFIPFQLPTYICQDLPTILQFPIQLPCACSPFDQVISLTPLPLNGLHIPTLQSTEHNLQQLFLLSFSSPCLQPTKQPQSLHCQPPDTQISTVYLFHIRQKWQLYLQH